jgi:hypothetical protein
MTGHPTQVRLTAEERHWVCPVRHCTIEARTRVARPHTPHHLCPQTGVMTPMVPKGARVGVTLNERQDYVGNELVQVDRHGRPIQSVVIEREDGTDCSVLAPTASVALRSELSRL